MQQGAFPVQNADARRPERLVAGERVKVAIKRLNVDRYVRDGLGPVHKRLRAACVRHSHHFGDRGLRSDRVGYLREGDKPGFGIQQPFVGGHDDLSRLVHGDCPQLGPLFRADHLPGYDVGVMLQHGNDDLVALLQVFKGIGLRHEVDALGRAPDKYDFIGAFGMKESCDLRPGAFVGVRRARGQGMRRPVNVGILVLVIVGEPVDDAFGLLRGGRVVKPDQIFSVNLFG